MTNSTRAEAQDLLATLARDVLAPQEGATVPVEALNHLLKAVEVVLAYPTLTRDLVSRGQVSTWLHETVTRPLRDAVEVLAR